MNYIQQNDSGMSRGIFPWLVEHKIGQREISNDSKNNRNFQQNIAKMIKRQQKPPSYTHGKEVTWKQRKQRKHVHLRLVTLVTELPDRCDSPTGDSRCLLTQLYTLTKKVECRWSSEYVRPTGASAGVISILYSIERSFLAASKGTVTREETNRDDVITPEIGKGL